MCDKTTFLRKTKAKFTYLMLSFLLTCFSMVAFSCASFSAVRDTDDTIGKCSKIKVGSSRDFAEAIMRVPLDLNESVFRSNTDECIIVITAHDRVSRIQIKFWSLVKNDLHQQLDLIKNRFRESWGGILTDASLMTETKGTLVAFASQKKSDIAAITLSIVGERTQITISIRSRRIESEDEEPGFYAR